MGWSLVPIQARDWYVAYNPIGKSWKSKNDRKGKGKGERELQWSNNCLKSEMPLPTTFI